jgi:hypothetical protein
MEKVAMHIHSCYSDGKDTPEKLIDKAVAENISAICLTDHDVFQGLGEFQCLAGRKNLITLPAMEVSSCWENRTYVHILAYGIKYVENETLLKNKLHRNLDAHNDNTMEILKRFALHYRGTISPKAVKQRIGQLGPILFPMPTMRFLDKFAGLENGEYWRVAFNNRPTYEDLILKGRYMDVADAMKLIKSVGGKAVWAHPGLFSTYTVKGGSGKRDFLKLLELLVDLGLSGLEVFYPSHSKEQTEYFDSLGGHYGLWKTAGSDFHGEYKTYSCGMSMPGMDFENFMRFKNFCESR